MQTYKFYTKKGERLAIFLRNTQTASQIEVYRCSRKDAFRKKTARDAFNGIPQEGMTFHPEIFPMDKALTGKEFYQWCVDNYCQEFAEVFVDYKPVFEKWSVVKNDERFCSIV